MPFRAVPPVRATGRLAERLVRAHNEGVARRAAQRAYEARQFSISAETAKRSAMICLVPDAGSADALAAIVPHGEPATDIHLTLLYYRDGLEQNYAAQRIESWAANWYGGPIVGQVNGVGRFSGDGPEGDALVALVDAPGLTGFWESLRREQAPGGYSANHGFTPHMTIAYLQPSAAIPPAAQRIAPLEVQFDALWVWGGGERRRYQLGR